MKSKRLKNKILTNLMTFMKLFSRYLISRVHHVQPQICLKGTLRSIALLFFLLGTLWPMGMEAQDDESKVMTYLTSKENFEKQIQDGTIIVYNAGTGGCYWDTDKNACRFTYNKETVTPLVKQNGIRIDANETTGPFSKVNEDTGFTIGWEAWSNYLDAGTAARFFDATIYDGNGFNDNNRTHIIGCKQNLNGNDGTADIFLAVSGNPNDEFTFNFAEEDVKKVIKSLGEWNSYQVVADHNKALRVYVNGILLRQIEANNVPVILNVIKRFNLSIGNSWAGLQGQRDVFQFDGWLKNFQIAGTDAVQRLKLKESTVNGEILVNSIPLSTAGTLVPAGSVVELSEKPEEGYHLDWESVKYQNISTNGKILGVTAANPSFPMPAGETELTGKFEQNQYVIKYNWNLKSNEEIVGGGTLSDGTKYHFEGFTAANTSKMKHDKNTGYYYIFKGWTTDPSKSDIEFEPEKPYSSGDLTNKLNGAKNGDTKTLYALWEVKTYTVSVDPRISGGTVTVQKDGGEASSKLENVQPGTTITIATTIDTENGYVKMANVTRKEDGKTTYISQELVTENKTFTITVGTADIEISAKFLGEKSITLIDDISDGELFVNDTKVEKSGSAVFIGNYVNVVVSPAKGKRLTGFKYRYINSSNESTVPSDGLPSKYDTRTGTYTVKLEDLSTDVEVMATFSNKTVLTGESNPESLTLTIDDADKVQLWTGNPMTAGYTLKKNGADPGENEYEVGFADNVDAGKAKGVITMKNNEQYSGIVEIADVFTIKYNLDMASVQVADQIYTGQSQTASIKDVTVTLGNGAKTVDQSHYEVTSVTAGTNVGVYDITVSAKGDYSQGRKDTKYKIVAADLGKYVSYCNADGTSSSKKVSNTDQATNELGFSLTEVKLTVGDVTTTLTSDQYRTAYVDFDGHEYLEKIPAGTFGKIFLAVAPKLGDPNLNGYYKTDKYISFRLYLNSYKREWSTYYNNLYNLTSPIDEANNVSYTVYCVTGISGNTVTLQTTNYIPKEVPVLLHRDENNYDNTGVELLFDQESTQSIPQHDAKFKGTASELDVTTLTGDVYILNGNQFVQTKSGNIPANRCYLLLNASSAAPVLGIGDGDTTGIVEIMQDLQQDQWYDLNGRKLKGPQGKGLYIVNGRKVIIK